MKRSSALASPFLDHVRAEKVVHQITEQTQVLHSTPPICISLEHLTRLAASLNDFLNNQLDIYEHKYRVSNQNVGKQISS